MNFDFSEEEIALREKIKGLFDSESEAALAQIEVGHTKQIKNLVSLWLRRLGDVGYLAIGLDKGKEGMGLLAAQEGLATISPSLFLSVEVSVRIFGRLVALYGTSDQKGKILPDLREGRLIGAVGLSEGGTSVESDPLETRGAIFGPGFQVSGSKSHVINAPIANWIAVAGKGEEATVFFLIRKGAEGLSIGQRLSTLGYNGVAISSVSLEKCPVSSDNVIGPFEGKNPLEIIRLWEDQTLTAASLGLMKRSFDTALNHAKHHRRGGKPIIAYQEVGFKLAEMLTLLQTARLLAYRALWIAEAGDREADLLTHCAKVFCAESAEEVASRALQILGAHGYVLGNPAEEGYREAKYLEIAGTSCEISRVKIGNGLLEGN